VFDVHGDTSEGRSTREASLLHVSIGSMAACAKNARHSPSSPLDLGIGCSVYAAHRAGDRLTTATVGGLRQATAIARNWIVYQS
jgi:hypothetical protein